MTSAALDPSVDLNERALALVPTLRERALETESLRRLPDETLEELRTSGLLAMITPASGGGLERDFESFLEATSIIARGCGSTGWCLGVMAVHNWLVGLFPEQAQREVFAGETVPSFAAVFAPMGKAEPTAGGVRLSGQWAFASGCDAGEWVAVAAPVSSDPPDLRMHLVPREDFEIIDTWHVAGLRGTGSKDIRITDAFVPDHRALSLVSATRGECPGHAVNDGPLFRVAFTSALTIALTGAALGIAEGAFEAFLERMRDRVLVFEGRAQKEQPAAQLRLAESSAEIEAARLLLRDSVRAMEANARAGIVANMDERVRQRRNTVFAVRLCVRAVDRLFEASGGSGLRDESPIQRAFRDIHAVSAHAILSWDTAADLAARQMLGIDLGPVFV